MEQFIFLIAHESYIVRRGLRSIILEHCPTSSIIEVGVHESVGSIIKSGNPDVILGQETFNVDIELCQNKYLINLGDKSSEDCINVFGEKSEILSVLQPILKELTPEKENSKDLSEREKDIVSNIALGLTNQEIAEKLFISSHTVITHRKNIVKKLGIKTVSGLTVYAIFNNLVDPNMVNS